MKSKNDTKWRLIAIAVLSFPVFGCIDSSTAFHPLEMFENNMLIKLAKAPRQLAELHALGLVDGDTVRFEIFFYSDDEEHVRELTIELAKMGYLVGYGQTFGSDSWIYVVTGTSIEIEIGDETIKKWVTNMCEIGYRFDSKFEEWHVPY